MFVCIDETDGISTKVGLTFAAVMADSVRIQIMPNEQRLTLAQFAFSGVPHDAEYRLDVSEDKDAVIRAAEPIYGQQYVGKAPPSDYYVGVRRKNVLEVYPISLFRMRPIVNPPEPTAAQLLDSQTPLTLKEQMDEIKEKFGSRRTQRQLASKRKYAIEFGEDDVEQVELKTRKVAESALEEKLSTSTLNDSLDILPHQNRDAICVEEVYDMNEIITEDERTILMPMIDDLFDNITDKFIKDLMGKQRDTEQKIIAVYIQLIVKLMNLKATQLRRADPLPELNSEVKEFLYARYLDRKLTKGNRYQYTLSAKEKDRLLIYGLILCIMLHNYRPIDFELMQKSFKSPIRQFRKVVEIIGCYVENAKNADGVNAKCLVFKVPLNTFSQSKTYRKR